MLMPFPPVLCKVALLQLLQVLLVPIIKSQVGTWTYMLPLAWLRPAAL